MHTIEKDCLIDFFKTINDNFDYIVLRNADELPFDNYSNDIDILIDENYYNSFDKIMKKVFLRHGFTRVERATTYGLECYTFYNIVHETSYSLKIDLFFNIEGGGIRYFNFNDLSPYKIANKNGIFVFDIVMESLITALKILTAGGRLKEIYLYNFLNNPPSLEYPLFKKCPSKTLVSYLNEILRTKKNVTNISRKTIVYEAFISNIKIAPISTIKRVLSHYVLEVKRAFNKQYMIALVGPNGSGKTTLINRLLDDSKLLLRTVPSRIFIFNNRPHLFQKTSNKFISFIELFYYSLDYLLGYFLRIIPLQRKNKFIIFNEYYFDLIFNQKESALNISEKTALLLYKLIVPKPNRVFYIKSEPTEIYHRKKEFSIEIIKENNSNYDRMSEKFDNFKIISNENFEKAYQEFLKGFIITISEEIEGNIND
jgi:thymidylate kinase